MKFFEEFERKFFFDDYQDWTDEVAIYPESNSGSSLALAYAGLGLGEAGEIQNLIKKILRDDNSELSEEKRQAIIAELGDLLWYVARIATELNVELSKVAKGNMDKLNDRKKRDVIKGSGDKR